MDTTPENSQSPSKRPSDAVGSSNTKNPQVWTIDRLLKWSRDFLESKGADSPRLDAELFLSKILALPRIQLYAQFDRILDSKELSEFRSLLERRVAGEPTAYIIGERGFMGHLFNVDPAVLVPRPDTELVVETIVQRFDTDNSYRILELGTGSGCIGISIASRFKKSHIEACDVSNEALEVAKGNSSKLGTDNIEFFNKCMLSADWSQNTYDIIVSNPPYISSSQIGSLSREVKDCEPHLALDGGEDGLNFYRAISENFSKALVDGGWLILEIGFDQGESVSGLLAEHGFTDIEILKDYGGNDRVVLSKR